MQKNKKTLENRNRILTNRIFELKYVQCTGLPFRNPEFAVSVAEDPTTNVVVYQYTRHIFGAKDSPTCANYALKRTARDNVNPYPEAISPGSRHHIKGDKTTLS